MQLVVLLFKQGCIILGWKYRWCKDDNRNCFTKVCIRRFISLLLSRFMRFAYPCLCNKVFISITLFFLEPNTLVGNTNRPESNNEILLQFGKSDKIKRGEPKPSSHTLCLVYVLLNYELNCVNASSRQHLYHVNSLIH